MQVGRGTEVLGDFIAAAETQAEVRDGDDEQRLQRKIIIKACNDE